MGIKIRIHQNKYKTHTRTHTHSFLMNTHTNTFIHTAPVSWPTDGKIQLCICFFALFYFARRLKAALFFSLSMISRLHLYIFYRFCFLLSTRKYTILKPTLLPKRNPHHPLFFWHFCFPPFLLQTTFIRRPFGKLSKQKKILH